MNILFGSFLKINDRIVSIYERRHYNYVYQHYASNVIGANNTLINIKDH